MAERSLRTRALRSRITLGAVTVVGIALVLGAVVFVSLVRDGLLDGVRSSADRHAASIEAQLTTSGIAGLLTGAEEDDDELYQVLSTSGEVLAASENASALPPLLSGGKDDTGFLAIADEDSDFVLVSNDVDIADDASGDDELVVITGASTEDVNDTLATVVPLVVVSLVVLLGVLAATTWIVAGRALRPVEAMRREVDAVTATNLHRRIADPGSNDEIGRLAQTMNRMLDRLDNAQTAQRRFISDASHELKSPLASLRQFAEVAKRYPDRVSPGDLSDAVLDEGARLERLVQNMLLLAHADEHSLALAQRDVDLDDILLAEASRLRSSSELRITSSGIGAGRVSGDAGLLGQVVRNLADNAARHAVGAVTLTLAESAGTVLLAIEDDGPGVPAAQRERVFERFVRLDDARGRDAGGSGLGLAIVREIVDAHGGSVVIGTGALGGARVEVRLPAAPDA
ncbi:MAG: Signal transduction histidine kinase [Glaciihabitans sp.]|nr:Signal transduction histidine kinase [Glaciihabitans sp.]